MHGLVRLCCSVTFPLAALCAQASDTPAAAQPAPIDFVKVERAIAKLPKLGDAPRYGLYLFGLQGETRVWAVLDRSGKGDAYDVLYFDKNANGDLTEDGERFVGTIKNPSANVAVCEFLIGDYRPPGADVAHKDFTVTWTAKVGVRFKTLWRGEKVTFGGYGPTRETYASFAESIAKAPIFVPGWDRPFEFERWILNPLKRGVDSDLKFFVGNRGDRVGAFSSVDDKFVPVTDSPVATLFYADQDGKQREQKWVLEQRC